MGPLFQFALPFVLLCAVNVLHAQSFVQVAASLGITHSYTNPNYSGGGSFADFDGDGLDDITLTQYNALPRCFRNTGSGFVQIPIGAQEALDMKSAVWVDYDNDGDRDLFCTSFNGPLRLFRNNGNLMFTEVSLAAGFGVFQAMSNSSAWGDYDRDGDLDVYICNYDGPLIGNSLMTNWLYRNNGDGTFTECAAACGVDNGNRYSYQANWMDYNHDMWPDLLVVNDRTSTENYLYHNNGDGTFTDVSDVTGIGNFLIFAMSATSDDYDNDGDPDIYITNGPAGNLFHVNQGDGTFTESAAEAGVAVNGYNWGANFLDADADGWQDLYVAASPFLGSQGLNSFFRNNGDGTFQNYLNEAGMIADIGYNFSNPIGDFNSDGRPDLLTSGGTPTFTRIWQNTWTQNQVLTVTLQGTQSNRDGVGSLITCYADSLVQTRYTHLGESWACQNSFREFFGLGQRDYIDSITVHWPSGVVDTWYNLPSGQHIRLIEGTGFNPDLMLDGESLICPGDSVLLVAGTSGNLVWSNGSVSDAIWIDEPGEYSYTLTIPGELISISPSVTVGWLPEFSWSAEVEAARCFGDSTGAIQFVADSLLWSNPHWWNEGVEISDWTHLPAGEYHISGVSDASCVSTQLIVIEEPEPVQMAVSVTDALCTGETGFAEVMVTGGHPPYALGESTPDLTQLPAGNYAITATDSLGCEAGIAFTVQEPAPLEMELIVTPFFEGGEAGTAWAQVTGGTPPYEWIWSNSAAADSLISGLNEGPFSLTVTDSRGCMIVSEGVIDFITGVGVNESAVWRVFPNPVMYGTTTLFNGYTVPVNAALCDLQGRILREFTLIPGAQILDISGLSTGVVVLRTIGGPVSLSLRICIGE
jgi:hypothetical protein